MPSFIDCHSHFTAVANSFLQLSLKNCTNIEEIQNQLLKFKNENKIPSGNWIIANGYDNNRLTDKRHITKNEIDKVLPDNPVVIKNQSEHNGIMNSLALQKLNITENTKAPEGGKIEKINNELTGYLEENAFIDNLKKVPMPSIKKFKDAFKKAEKKYASYGITTVQEGFMTKELLEIYKEIFNKNELKLDFVAYVDKNIIDEVETAFLENIREYKNNLRIGGIKIFLDGSPQARTAWMREPYLLENYNGEGKKEDISYCGYGTMSDAEVKEAIDLAGDKKMQILVHCNGDRAAQQYIDAVKNMTEQIQEVRPVLIHGQLIGLDQLDEIKKLGIIPSYFISHVFYWGDVHIKNFGIKRAENISPAKSTLDKKIIFTFHQDSPVIEPNMLETIWCAVNRQTKDGITLGEKEKIDVLDAIKAVTINAAYQYFEENEKGSIKEGKIADLIILDENPFEAKEIKNIRVHETIKNGETIYRA